MQNNNSTKAYRIVEIVSYSEKSAICFPILVPRDANTNFRFIPIHNKDLIITKFQEFDTSSMQRIHTLDMYPSNFLEKSYTEGDYGPVILFNRFKNRVYSLEEDDGIRIIEQEFAEYTSTYSMYYMKKIFEQRVQYLESEKSKVSGGSVAWARSETFYNQRSQSFWSLIDRKPDKDYDPAHSIDNILAGFSGTEAVVEWLRENCRSEQNAIRNKWSLLFDYAHSFHLIDNDETNEILTEYLIIEEFSSHRFQKLFSHISLEYYQGKMRVFQDYIVDKIEEVTESANLSSYEYVEFTFNSLMCFVTNRSDYEMTFDADEILFRLDELNRRPSIRNRYHSIDPFHEDWVILSIASMLDSTTSYPGLGLRMIMFCMRYLSSEVQNEASGGIIAKVLYEYFRNELAPKLAQGIVISDIDFQSGVLEWMETESDIRLEYLTE